MTSFFDNLTNKVEKLCPSEQALESDPLTSLSHTERHEISLKIMGLPGFNEGVASSTLKLINQIWHEADYADFNYQSLFDCTRALGEFLKAHNKTLADAFTPENITSMANKTHEFAYKTSPLAPSG